MKRKGYTSLRTCGACFKKRTLKGTKVSDYKETERKLSEITSKILEEGHEKYLDELWKTVCSLAESEYEAITSRISKILSYIAKESAR